MLEDKDQEVAGELEKILREKRLTMKMQTVCKLALGGKRSSLVGCCRKTSRVPMKNKVHIIHGPAGAASLRSPRFILITFLRYLQESMKLSRTQTPKFLQDLKSRY